MPKQSSRVDNLSFSKGFNTEASPVNFPPDYTIDEQNFALRIDGSRERRLGMKLEGITFPNSEIKTDATTTYLWKNVDSIAGLNFIVIQVGVTIFFFDESADVLSDNLVCSCDLLSFSKDKTYSFTAIDGKLVVASGAEEVAICSYNRTSSSITVTYSRLKVRDQWGITEITGEGTVTRVVSGSLRREGFGTFEDKVYFGVEFNYAPYIELETGVPFITFLIKEFTSTYFVVEYNILPYSGESTVIMWRAQGLLPNTTSSSDSLRVTDNDYRRYNLYNQGWGANRKDANGNAVNPVDYFLSNYRLLPANNESVYTGLQYQAGYWNGDAWTQPWERIYLHMYDDSFDSTETKAAKGSFIIDLLRRGQGRRDAMNERAARFDKLKPVSIHHEDYTQGGPTCVADFSGHVFFGGFEGGTIDGDSNSPNLASYVAFSKLVRSIEDINKCYQEGDPTSREENDVIDTDGGLIRVSGAQGIMKLTVCSKGLLIFARNGVWLLLGGSDYGFTATNYKQQKLSEFGAISKDSIIGEDNNILYWSYDGIYQIAPDQFGDLQVNKISQNTIQKYFDSIPNSSKENATGVYDFIAKRVSWCFLNSSGETEELVLDMSLKAFTKNKFYKPATYLRVVSPVPLVSSKTVNGVSVSSTYFVAYDTLVDVFQTDDNGDIIIDEDGERVLIGTFTLTGFSFGYLVDKEFIDFSSIKGGGEVKSYILTGCNTAGDTGVPKQIPYLILHFKKTEEPGTVDGPNNKSSCMVSTRWDWSNSGTSNRWSQPFQAYRIKQPKLLSDFDLEITDYDVITTKSKIRGRGKSFAFYLESEEGKDCKLLGWNITLNGNQIT